MATLQSIRSKGPLLVIVIGLALFAFIAGDAWKVIQPHQSQDVGEAGGKSLSAQEFQEMVEEYSTVVKMSNNISSLTEEQTNQIKDEVWMSYVNNALVKQEAEKLGLRVTEEEIQNLISEGTHPMLRNTVFTNPQTGTFSQDMLKKVLADYASMSKSGSTSGQYFEYVASMSQYWSFLERRLVEMRLAEKYNALISKAVSPNSMEVRSTFDGRVNQKNVLFAGIPFKSIPDSTIKVKMSEVKERYNKKKELYVQLEEGRDVRYIDVHVTASAEDKAQLQNELAEYAEQLREVSSDYASFVRGAGSEYPYVDLFYTKGAFPTDVAARIDSIAMGEVYGPYLNATDNTLNVLKKIAKATMADSIEYRQIQVYEQDVTKTRALGDSIYNAIKGGANFTELAEKYNQPGTTAWISSANYENAQLDNDNLKYLSAITSLGVNETANVQVGVANVIIQVTNKKAVKDKYKVAVVKRTINFSQETYNRAFNDFSQFVAANHTLESLVANAEDAGYNLLMRKNLRASEHTIGYIKGTKEALRWAYSAKPNEVSELYECGDNDRLLVVALERINKKGYTPVEDVQTALQREIINEKKAEEIVRKMKAVNATSISDYSSMNDVVTDSVKFVTFNAPAYVSAFASSEPVLGACASITPVGQMSAPFKGNSGVMVIQPYAEEKTKDEFNAESERRLLDIKYQQQTSNMYIMSALYKKGDVQDRRYLFF